MENKELEFLNSDLLSEWESDDLVLSSELGLRDENKQFRSKKIIRYVEKKEDTSKILLVLKQFAAPYDAKTLKISATYNDSNKFRPSLAPSTVIREMLITKALKDEDYKERFMKKFKFEPTIEMVTAPLSKEVIDAFQDELKCSIFTSPTIVINDPAITGSQFAKKYVFETEDLSDYSFEERLAKEPAVKKVERLLSAIAFNQAAEKKKDPEHLKQPDNKRKEDIRAIWNARQIQGETPDNKYAIIQLGIKDGEILDDVMSMSDQDIWDKIVFEKKIAKDDKLFSAIKSSIEGNKDLGIPSKDIYGDFYEITMTVTKVTPNERGEKDYQAVKDATTFTPTDIIKSKLGDEAINRITVALDNLTSKGKEDLEKKVGKWIPGAKYTPTFEEALFKSIEAQMDLVTMRKYLKEDDIEQYGEALAILGGKCDQLVNFADDGELIEGATDTQEAEKESKEHTEAEMNIFGEDSFNPVTESEFPQY